MILKLSSKLTPDVVDKSLRISDIFLKKGFKIKPRYQSDVFVVALMLNFSKAN